MAMKNPKPERFQRQQREIQPAQRLGQLFEVFPRRQRHVLQKCQQIAARQRADDRIDRQRKYSRHHSPHARHDQIMHRVDAQRLQRLDLAHGAGRPEFNHMCRPHPRQHQHRRQQRPQFAHHHNHHGRAEIIRRAHPRQGGHRLADDEESQGGGNEQEHRQQRHAGTGDFLPDARPHHVSRHVVFFQHDPQRDQRKRAQPLDREQQQEQFPAQQVGVGFGQGGPAKHLRVRQFKRLGQIPAHAASVEHYAIRSKRFFLPSHCTAQSSCDTG